MSSNTLNRTFCFLLQACLILNTQFSSQVGAIEPGRLWFYAPVNFQVNDRVDQLHDLMRRAKLSGYNGAVITDYKFGNFDDRPNNYFKNLKRTAQLASELQIELIPCVMPIGYSNSILQNDPDLAAGIPVKNSKLVVHDGIAALPANNLLLGGSFEKPSDQSGRHTQVPAGWDWIDGWGKSSRYDTSEKHFGNASLSMSQFRQGQKDGNCRVVKTINVQPYRQYRFSVWAKSENLDAELIQMSPLVNGKPISFANIGIQNSQPWTKHTIVFNSMSADKVGIYLGIWGGRSGKLWLDDARLEEIAGVNLLRRAGCPLAVRNAKTRQVYLEGRDFEPWKDLKLGCVPYAGEYSDDHEAPPIELTRTSRIRDGDELLVSFYHTVIVGDIQVCSSLMEDQIIKLMEQQVRAISRIWSPKTYFLQHDEIRVAGHDKLAQGRSAGELLADNVRRCEQAVHRVSPEANLVIWSDMFDPFHNARDSYYLTKETMKGSWEGLSPSTTIANWNLGKARDSLDWFAKRKHTQIVAGYYDQAIDTNVASWKQAIGGTPKVIGWIYTTWQRDYSNLEAFAKRCKAKR